MSPRDSFNLFNQGKNIVLLNRQIFSINFLLDFFFFVIRELF